MAQQQPHDVEASDAASAIAVPTATDDKYSRGVLGIVTGSAQYPGAAVLSVEGAARTGVGMVRYLGPERATDLVLRARPEVVTADGRVQAWLMGSGMADVHDPEVRRDLTTRLADGTPTVLDAGALELVEHARGPAVLTPHHGELARVLQAAGERVTREQIAADPAHSAARAAALTRATVLLKGGETIVADASGPRFRIVTGVGWLATAGSGDVLAGVLGALVATHARALAERPALLAELAAAAAWLHGAAGRVASGGGPIQALDIAHAMPRVIARLLDPIGTTSAVQSARLGDHKLGPPASVDR